MNDQNNWKEYSPIEGQPAQSEPHPLDAKRDDGPDCVSQDHPDPLVSDCDDLLRKDLSEELERKRAGMDPEPEPDWTDKAKKEIVAGLDQIRDALQEAYREGKSDPKVKKFGEDVKETFRSIGDEISKIFD
ncbi:MAG TPA: hypothetical protein PKY64_06095 [Anaerolineaceae bacterium]|nr:hypothetical protein [Anaerolineaceae bacterium]